MDNRKERKQKRQTEMEMKQNGHFYTYMEPNKKQLMDRNKRKP